MLHRHQRMHVRRSKKGKLFKAGSVKIEDIPQKTKKEIIADFLANTEKTLKQEKKVRVGDLGILRIKKSKAHTIPKKPAGERFNLATGKVEFMKATPAKKVPAKMRVRFRASKGLKKIIGG